MTRSPTLIFHKASTREQRLAKLRSLARPKDCLIGVGGWVVGRGSWVVGRGSWVVGRGSWVVGRGHFSYF